MDRISHSVARIRSTEFYWSAIVFVVMVLCAKFGQYLFFEWDTSPAVLWPAAGVGLAIIWLGGYRYVWPVFLGLLVASFIGPARDLIPAVVTTPLGQTAGFIVGVYLLRKGRFDGSFSTIRDVLLFLGVIAIASMIAPTITTFVSWVTDNLTATPYVSWSRSWAGYMLSCLIVTPLIIAWGSQKEFRPQPRVVETFAAGALLLVSVYFLFWTRAASEFSFLFFGSFFLAHFWVAFRFSTKMLTLSLLGTTVLGFLGLFLSPVPGTLLNDQLFSAELFLFLVTPIFYIFSALVKERANTVEELEQAMGRIAREGTIKNEFIVVLAHELRNPLAPVKTTLEILELQAQDPDMRHLIKRAHQQVHSMRRLLDDLLDITRVTQGKFTLKLEHCNACGLIRRCVESVQELIKERQHTLIVDPVCDETLWLDVDPVRFEQVLINLLNNAAKYTDPGGRIEIHQSVKDDRLVIQVRDNGKGIAPEHQEKIFQPFWQMESSSLHGQGGVGIGLSLTKHIVDLHGGTITVESEGIGKGSLFTVMFPLKAEGQPVAVHPVEVKESIRPFRVLIVDDNHRAADALVKLLTLKGHTASAVYAGSLVPEAMESFKPEVVLLDIGLPDLTGHEVVRDLRERGYAQHIIALSGYGQKEDKEKALASGFDHHITKPMSIEQFESYLRELQKDE